MAEGGFDAARQLRAIRRARTLSQRELASAAGVPVSTISAIEAGRRVPGLTVFTRILAGAGFGLEVADRAAGSESDSESSPRRDLDSTSDFEQRTGDVLLRPDDEHDAVRDRGGRRFPAHLRWGGRPEYTNGPYWWGWSRIAWYRSDDPAVPEHVYWHRPRPRPSRLGREPREHPFWG